MEGDANICFIGIPSTSPTLPFMAANPSGRKKAPSSEKKCQNDYFITQGRQKNARTQKWGKFSKAFFAVLSTKEKSPMVEKHHFFLKGHQNSRFGNTAASPLPLALHIFPGLGIKEKGEGWWWQLRLLSERIFMGMVWLWVSEGERRCRGRKHTLGFFKSLSVGRKIRNYHGSSLAFL